MQREERRGDARRQGGTRRNDKDDKDTKGEGTGKMLGDEKQVKFEKK